MEQSIFTEGEIRKLENLVMNGMARSGNIKERSELETIVKKIRSLRN